MDIKIVKSLVSTYALQNVTAYDLDDMELLDDKQMQELFVTLAKDTGDYTNFQMMELALTALYFKNKYEEIK
jgi:hypothetical protein